jgi:Tol biopolymer transport system component
VRRNADGSDEIFRYDRGRRRFQQLTRDRLGDGSSYNPAISGDGLRVVFETSSNLRGRNPDFSNEVYLFNRSGNIALSRDPEGEGESTQTAISGDGKLVAFISSSNLTGRNADFSSELMLYDVTKRRLSQVTNDPEGNGESSQPAISGDGRFITFVSSSNLAFKNPENYSPVWIRTPGGSNNLVTTTPEGPFDADSPTINYDGRFIAFLSTVNLTGENADGSLELLLYNRTRKTYRQLTSGPTNCFPVRPRISWDGSRIAYLSNCNPLGTNADRSYEVFVIDNPALNLVVHAEGPVRLVLTDPNGRAVSHTSNNIANATYESSDFDGDTVPETRITVPQAVEGRYRIQVVAAPGASPGDPVSLNGTLNDVTVPLVSATDTVESLAGVQIGFSNQGFLRPSSRITPLNGTGSRLFLGTRLSHPRAASGPVIVRFNSGSAEQAFDFGPIENFRRGGLFSGVVDGFTTTLRVRNRTNNTSSLSLSAKNGDLSEFEGTDNLNMTMSVRIGYDTDMYNFRFLRSLRSGQLNLR